MSQTAENHHPLAVRMFRDWLRERYDSPEDWFSRTGLQHWDHIKIPHYPNPRAYNTFDQPIAQEYRHFKSQLLGDYAAEMATFIHSLNPETAIEFNPHGVGGHNQVLLRNIDHPRILP